ncbi:MAG: phosphoribosyltransferase [Pirellulaceae bacterium]
MAFRNRVQAGQILADKLVHYRDSDDVLVLALPRGGVPVAFEVAKALQAQLEVFLVRKLGLPDHEELAMGAIASGGIIVLNREVVDGLGISDRAIQAVAARERRELERREREYRGDRPSAEVAGRIVIVIDDGLATGATMRAAVEALRRQQPKRLVVAVPVAAPSTCEEFREHVDETVCAITPDPFFSVGMWYDDFLQTSDHDVKRLLAEAEHWSTHPAPHAG